MFYSWANTTAHVLPHLHLSRLIFMTVSFFSRYLLFLLHTLTTDTHTKTDKADSSRLVSIIHTVHTTCTLTNTHVHTGCVELNSWRCAVPFFFFSFFLLCVSLQFKMRKCRLFSLNVITVFCFPSFDCQSCVSTIVVRRIIIITIK